MDDNECLICNKHKGNAHQPPGGYIYRGEHFSVCHAPLTNGPLGTLFIESNRHYFDYSDMSTDESIAYGILLKNVYCALREITSAARIYQVTLIEGIPHFRSWLIPRRDSNPERGIAFLSLDLTCNLKEVENLVGRVRGSLK